MDPTRILLLISFLYYVSCEEISFESGVSFETVEQSKIPNSAEYDDVENTGSYLFDAEVNNNKKKRLSLGVPVDYFKSLNSRYFRAHPDFMPCVQKVITSLQNQGKNLRVVSGYQTKSDTNNGNSIEDRYARSGTGIKLKYQPGVTGDLKDIAAAALKKCPVHFERLQRNLGVVLGNGYVHLHMTSTENAALHVSLNGISGMTDAELQSWALNQIDAGLDPVGSPDCSKITGLDNGGFYPSGVTTPQEAIGDVDIPISREVPEDFKRLVQYQGRNIEFVNNERTAAWCGIVGNNCLDCREKPLGNSLNQRCAARLMSQRMYNVLISLQKLVRANGDKLKVEQAFDEKYAGHVADFDATSLYTEGRLVKVTRSVNPSLANYKKLTQWAICSKADFVQNNGDHVLIGVKKMYGRIAQKIEFPLVPLLRVEPPQAKKDMYSLPNGFTVEDEEDYPLIDSSSQEDLEIALDTPLSLFMSKDPNVRYLRLHPLIADCYSQIVYHLNKHNKATVYSKTTFLTDPKINVDVVRGFMSTEEQQLKLAPSDRRYNTMTLGTGFEIKYSSNNTVERPLYTLVKQAVDYCGPLFNDGVKEEMGVGLYQDKIFVDMRSDFDVWTKASNQLPEGKTLSDYREDMLQRFELAVDNRIVDPDNLERACILANHPGLQHADFNHEHTEHVKRRRRAAPEPDDCVPVSDTEFCTSTLKHRQTEVDHIWTELTRKWLYRNETEVREALEGCFLACGTCLTGTIYEDKVEDCNNFLHWVPFDLMNDAPGITNIFPRDSMYLRGRACSHGHCIEDAPLFHLVASSAEAIYRPDPEMSVENELYPQAENPSPVFELLHRIYTIHASGTVKFWVRDENDMLSLLSPLQDAMLYNKNVTDVEVFVLEKSKMDAVDSVIQSAVADWSSSGCPKVTREIIAPSKVLPLPEDVGKRSPHSAVREEIINHYTSWEARWANMEI
ncbi:hypothetical protein LOTGIDRAFT_235988 [Lottia gigantea]|uniref:Hedgehog N-terminal signalling domain-containing protein n=1 Tax=Lottia gigantea TaxID=225164 RepID=V4B8A6_LOTGI|nr:hypothetical protein LOTGIDRAFT_235988 [Lottia gigantea]ESO84934.1 hypothetical protein LOTGIDRAFT_235988 [Lottia gigantea]